MKHISTLFFILTCLWQSSEHQTISSGFNNRTVSMADYIEMPLLAFLYVEALKILEVSPEPQSFNGRHGDPNVSDTVTGNLVQG